MKTSNGASKRDNVPIDLFNKNRSVLIYAEGAFGLKSREKLSARAKTADGVLRYAKYKIAGVIDSLCQETEVSEVLDIRKKIPVFKTVAQAKKETKADTLLIGIAPEGGRLPNRFLKDILWALENDIDIINGMHTSVCSFPRLKKTMEKNNRKVWETRIPPTNLPIAGCRVYQEIKKPVILTVGADAAIGKLTATYELAASAQKKGYKTQIIPTGQTAIMIEGWGIAIDKCEGDFMAGAVEKMILDKEKENDPDIYFVEGQGSLFHPAYSTTSLALIHGSCPTHLVLVLRPQRKRITGCPLLPMPEIKKAVETYENAVIPPFRKTKVVAIALNTQGLGEKQAREIIENIKKQTGRPTTDLIRWPENWTELFIN